MVLVIDLVTWCR